MADSATSVDNRRWEALWESLQSYLEPEGVELDDLDVRGRGSGRILRVIVDTPGGIDVERIAELARGLSRMLDESDPVDGGYTLEVSSPGLERQLRRPAHFAKAVGREVDIRTSDEIDGARRHRGLLESADEDRVQLVVDGATRTIPMTAVERAKTIFRWEKSPKPGGKRGKR